MSASWGEQLLGKLADGTQPGATATGLSFDCPGGLMVFVAVATAWAGATVTLQILAPDGVTWLAASANTTLTANGSGSCYMGPGRVRAAITGGPPTAVFATLARVVG